MGGQIDQRLQHELVLWIVPFGAAAIHIAGTVGENVLLQKRVATTQPPVFQDLPTHRKLRAVNLGPQSVKNNKLVRATPNWLDAPNVIKVIIERRNRNADALAQFGSITQLIRDEFF